MVAACPPVTAACWDVHRFTDYQPVTLPKASTLKGCCVTCSAAANQPATVPAAEAKGTPDFIYILDHKQFKEKDGEKITISNF